MVKVEVTDALVDRVRKLHKRYSALDAKHTVTSALEDYIELTDKMKAGVKFHE